jgi:hypothetical protein
MIALTGNGRLTRDPQLRTTRSGKTVATLSVASDRRDRSAPAVYIDLILWEAQGHGRRAAPGQGPGRLLLRSLRAQGVRHPGRRPAGRARAARRRARVQGQAPRHRRCHRRRRPGARAAERGRRSGHPLLSAIPGRVASPAARLARRLATAMARASARLPRGPDPVRAFPRSCAGPWSSSAPLRGSLRSALPGGA